MKPNPVFYAAVAAAAVMVAAAALGLAWLGRKLKAGPGPDSRLERLLRDIDDEGSDR